MSMWEFEALGEMSVEMVDASDLTAREKRNAYASIYALIGDWDVSFIHFRSTKALAAAAFFHRIDIEQHPDYVRYQDYFAPIVAAGKPTWIGSPATGLEEYPSDAFYQPPSDKLTFNPGVWFDSTMPLRPRAVEVGLLSGLAAEPLQEWSRVETITRLMTLAAQENPPRYGLLKMLHGMLAYTVLSSENVPQVGDEILAVARDLPALKQALATPQEDWIDERFDARQSLDYAEGARKALLQWWCAVYPE